MNKNRRFYKNFILLSKEFTILNKYGGMKKVPVTKSPLRYPGGKTQLNEFVANVLNINGLENVTYCEPFREVLV